MWALLYYGIALLFVFILAWLSVRKIGHSLPLSLSDHVGIVSLLANLGALVIAIVALHVAITSYIDSKKSGEDQITKLQGLQATLESSRQALDRSVALATQQLGVLQATKEAQTSRPDIHLSLVRNHSNLAAKVRNVGKLKPAKNTTCEYYIWNLDEPGGKSFQLVKGNARFEDVRPGDTSGFQLLVDGYKYKTSPAFGPGNRLLGYLVTSCPECKTKRTYWTFLTLGTRDGWYIEESNPINPLEMSKKQLSLKGEQLKRRKNLKQIGTDPQLP